MFYLSLNIIIIFNACFQSISVAVTFISWLSFPDFRCTVVSYIPSARWSLSTDYTISGATTWKSRLLFQCQFHYNLKCGCYLNGDTMYNVCTSRIKDPWHVHRFLFNVKKLAINPYYSHIHIHKSVGCKSILFFVKAASVKSNWWISNNSQANQYTATPSSLWHSRSGWNLVTL